MAASKGVGPSAAAISAIWALCLISRPSEKYTNRNALQLSALQQLLYQRASAVVDRQYFRIVLMLGELGSRSSGAAEIGQQRLDLVLPRLAKAGDWDDQLPRSRVILAIWDSDDLRLGLATRPGTRRIMPRLAGELGLVDGGQAWRQAGDWICDALPRSRVILAIWDSTTLPVAGDQGGSTIMPRLAVSWGW